MTLYLGLKTIHIVSSTILFGTGIGIAFFKWVVDRTNNVSAIRVVSERLVLADWVFTAPAILIQPVSGIGLSILSGSPLLQGWLGYSITLYLVTGACWIPVVWMQLRMRDYARLADSSGTALDSRYWVLSRYWLYLGIPAFTALLLVFWLMVAKPPL